VVVDAPVEEKPGYVNKKINDIKKTVSFLCNHGGERYFNNII
jgi:hypothetical protein